MEEMDEGLIVSGAERKISYDRGHSQVVSAQHETRNDQHEPAERSLPAETVTKRKKDIFYKLKHFRTDTWQVKGYLSGFSQSCGHFFKGCRQIRFIFTELCDLSSEFKDLMVLLADLIQ